MRILSETQLRRFEEEGYLIVEDILDPVRAFEPIWAEYEQVLDRIADSLYAEYGESAGGGIRAGKQDPVFEGGNEYLKKNFPLLDYITRACVEVSTVDCQP